MSAPGSSCCTTGNDTVAAVDDSEDDQWEYYDDSTTLSDFWQALTGAVKTTNPCYDPLELWLADIGLGEDADKDRENVFREYWRTQVPRFLSHKHGYNSITQVWDKASIKACLIDPLDAFVCGTSEAFESVYNELATNDIGQPAMCGHVFATDEACYSCRDCGQDHTCVMCSECFQNSEHQHHKYKMYSSEGGGYCDCGDEEAFLRFHVCSKHIEQRKDGTSTTNSPTADDSLRTMPLDMKIRTKRLFLEIMRYIFEVTSTKRKFNDFAVGGKDKEMWPELKHTFEFSNKCLILVNDNFHNYEEVSKVVKRCLPNCSQKMAHDVTEYVDKEGRAIVSVGKHEDLAPIRDKIESTSRRDGRSLKCEIVPSYVIAHQNFAVRLLAWLCEILKRHSGFRAMFVNIAQAKEGTPPEATIQLSDLPEQKELTICEAILINDVKMWKVVRKAWVNVVIEGIMKDYEAKNTFAQYYVKHYNTIMAAFVGDDQETDISITNLSVQIFTVPTIAHNLVEFHNAFHIMAEYFRTELQEQKTDGGPLLLEQWMEDVHNEFDRVYHVLLDMQYLLSKPPAVTDTWSEKMRQSFYVGAQTFIKILSAFQGIDPHRRETHQHVEFESAEWENVNKLTEPITVIAEKVIEWCKSDKIAFTKVLDKAVQFSTADFSHRFSKYEPVECNAKLQEVDVEGNITMKTVAYRTIDIDVSREPVSVNIPLQRFLGGLIPCINQLDLKRVTDRITESTESFSTLIEPVITALTMLSQAACNLWRRNGSSIDGISYIYHQWCPSSKQNDLIMLQLAAVLSKDFGGCIVQTLLHRFRLIKWATGEPEEDELDEEASTTTSNVADEFLKILLAMLSERFTYNIGKVTKKEEIRYHVAHALCTGPLSHSDIQRQLRHRIKDGYEGDYEDVIKEVGRLTQSKKDPSKRVFELKEEYGQIYNPFYYYYSKEQNSAAITTQGEKLRSTNAKKLECLLPPKMPPLTDLFAKLPKVASCFAVLKVIDTTLKKFIPTSEENECNTDSSKIKVQENATKHLYKVLFIIVIGCEDDLREAQNDCHVGSSFVQAAERIGLVEKLSNIKFISSPPQDVKDMVQYTREKLIEARCQVLNIGPNTTDKNCMELSPNTNSTAPCASKYQKTNSNAVDNSDNEARVRRAEAAAIHRAKVMAQMNNMQKQFMEKNASTMDEMMDTEPSSEAQINKVDETEKCEVLEKRIVVGDGKTMPKYDNKRMTCILCQEEQSAWSEISDSTKDVLVMACYNHKSTVLSQFDIKSFQDSNSYCSDSHLLLKFGCGPVISSCGHVMHAKCYQNFIDSLVTKERENLFRQILNYNISMQEYLCPICERLCNNVLPLLPPVTQVLPTQNASKTNLEKWIKTTKDILSEKYLDEPNGGASALATPSLPPSIRDIVHLVLKKPLLPLKGTASFPKISEPLRSMSIAFAMNTFSKSLSAYPSDEDARVLHLNLQSLILSIHLSQCAIDESFEHMIMDLTCREIDTLKSLCRLSLLVPFTFFQKANNPTMKYLRSNAIYLLSILLLNDIEDRSFGDFDAFGLLVFLIASYPSLTYPDRESNFALGKEDHNIVLLCFVAHILQILMNYPNRELDKIKTQTFGPTAEDDSCIKQLIQKMSEVLGKDDSNYSMHKQTEHSLSNVVKTKLLRFLRCSAMFFHLYTDIPLPDNPLISGTSKRNVDNPQPIYETLTAYLGLPSTFTSLIQMPGVSELIHSLLACNKLNTLTPIDLPAPRRRLIDLPENYLTLLTKADQYKCPNSVKGESKSPAICLVCGTIVCSQSTCCELQIDRVKAGGCTVHARRCGGDNGIFLRLRRCQIILLSDVKRGVLLPAPYVDEYGECDEGLKRGNPLKLDAMMYEELNKVWLTNDIPDKISRHFDTEVVTISARWYEL